MHELSIALSVLDLAADQARSLRGARITAIRLRVGPLSGVMPRALLGAFELARVGTDFADCRLIIDQTPAIIRCPNCRADRAVESIQNMACAICGTASADVVGGRELEVCAMEIQE